MTFEEWWDENRLSVDGATKAIAGLAWQAALIHAAEVCVKMGDIDHKDDPYLMGKVHGYYECSNALRESSGE